MLKLDFILQLMGSIDHCLMWKKKVTGSMKD